MKNAMQNPLYPHTGQVSSLLPYLPPEVSQRLQEGQEAILSSLVLRNAGSIYYKESPDLRAFREFIDHGGQNIGDLDLARLRTGFHDTVPLSTYETYIPFMERFFEKPCNHSRVVDLFAPGLPSFIALSSATSRRGKSKAFAKYGRPVGISSEGNIIPGPKCGGSLCRIFSLETYEILRIEDNKGVAPQTMPVTCLSAGRFSELHGLDLTSPQSFRELKVSPYSSPLAVGFISHYRTFLLMHALFALQDPKVEIFYPIFSTTFFDLTRFMEDQWDSLVQAVESGKIPEYEGLTNEIKAALQIHFQSNPTRAAELRSVARSDPGWMKQVWPMLTTAVVIASGVFAALIPNMEHCLGPDVALRGVGLVCTESIVALMYDEVNLNLFKMNTEDFHEYLDSAISEENSSNLKFAWEVQAGCKYEIVMTTRDGLWRYQLGDIVEVVGFDPMDGLPVIRYCGRKNAAMRLEGELVSEHELKSALASAKLSLGSVSEFCVVVDHRSTPSAYGFLVELPGVHGTDAATAKKAILHTLCAHNESYNMEYEARKISPPTIRILKPGTFVAFRQWRIETENIGAAQVKIPVVVSDEAIKSWLLLRVEVEL